MTKEQLVQMLLRKRYPDADPMYDLYKRTGALEIRGLLDTSPPMPAEEKARRVERYEQIRTAEDQLLSMSYEELQVESAKEIHIDLLCQLTIPGYGAADPQRAHELARMAMPGPAGLSLPVFPSFDPVETVRKADALKAELRGKSLDDVKAALEEARVKQWREGKHSLDEAAALIAAKIFPDDGCPWTPDDRKQCADEYKAYLRRAVIAGAVPFHNPYNRGVFDYERLSEERFPENGLIARADFHRCMMAEHAAKGYFPAPRQISKAPPPITPLQGRSYVAPLAPAETQVTRPAVAPVVPEEVPASPQAKAGAPEAPRARKKPQGGDSLTPMIWEICYDLRDAGQEVTAKPVMAELKRRAAAQVHPLVGSVLGGVAYEYEKGEETELDAEQLRGRIREWKRLTQETERQLAGN